MSKRSTGASTAPPPSLLDAEEPAKVIAQELPVQQIEANPFQPRRNFDKEAMADMVASVKEHGVIQPILVRPKPDRKPEDVIQYQLVAGERRWRASTLAGVPLILAIVRNLSDQQAAELALIENVTRDDISLEEAADACWQLITKFGYNEAMAAQKLSKSESHVSQLIKLAQLNPDVKKMFNPPKKADWTFSLAHVDALWKFQKFPAFQKFIADSAWTRHSNAKTMISGMHPYDIVSKGHAQYVHAGTCKFNWQDICSRCPHDAFVELGHQRVCLRPDELARKNEEHLALARDEAIALLQRQDGRKIIDLTPLDFNTYQELSYSHNRATGCTEKCECRGLGLNRAGRVVPVCLNPAQLEKHKKKDAKDQKSKRKIEIGLLHEKAAEVIEAAYGNVANVNNWQLLMPVIACQVLRHVGKAAVADVVKEMSIEFNVEEFFTWSISEVNKIKALSQFHPDFLMRLCGHALISKEYDEMVDFGRTGSPIFAALLEQWPATQLETDEDKEEFVDNFPPVEAEAKPFLQQWEDARRSARGEVFGSYLFLVHSGDVYLAYMDDAMTIARHLKQPVDFYDEGEGENALTVAFATISRAAVEQLALDKHNVLIAVTQGDAWHLEEKLVQEQPEEEEDDEMDFSFTDEFWEARAYLMKEFPGRAQILFNEEHDLYFMFGEEASIAAVAGGIMQDLEEVECEDEDLPYLPFSEDDVEGVVNMLGLDCLIWNGDGKPPVLDICCFNSEGEQVDAGAASVEDKEGAAKKAESQEEGKELVAAGEVGPDPFEDE